MVVLTSVEFVYNCCLLVNLFSLFTTNISPHFDMPCVVLFQISALFHLFYSLPLRIHFSHKILLVTSCIVLLIGFFLILFLHTNGLALFHLSVMVSCCKTKAFAPHQDFDRSFDSTNNISGDGADLACYVSVRDDCFIVVSCQFLVENRLKM